jgi:hypothetical protein
MCIASPMHISKPQQLNPTQVSNVAAEKIERGGEGGASKQTHRCTERATLNVRELACSAMHCQYMLYIQSGG